MRDLYELCCSHLAVKPQAFLYLSLVMVEPIKSSMFLNHRGGNGPPPDASSMTAISSDGSRRLAQMQTFVLATCVGFYPRYLDTAGSCPLEREPANLSSTS